MSGKKFSRIPEPNSGEVSLKRGLPNQWSKREPILEERCLKRNFLRLNKIFTWCPLCKDLVNKKTGFKAPDWVKEIMQKFPKKQVICKPCAERTFPRHTSPLLLTGKRMYVEEDIRRERESGFPIKGRK